LPQDVLAAVDYLIGVKFGMGTLDDIDHLRNRRIRSVADLLQNQFRLALGHLEDAVRRTIHRETKRRSTPQNLVTSTLLKNTFQYFFGSHPLSQFLDQTNPLTEIAHGRKLSHLGPGGLTG
jgi:DNA-directed RNA polymerase subunit beta